MQEKGKVYRENAHKIPQQYFETFEDRLMKRLDAEQELAKPANKYYGGKFWAIAACIMMLCFAFLLFRNDNINNIQLAANEPDSSELAAYENSIEISEDEFEEMIPTSFIDSMYNTELELASSENGEIDQTSVLELEEEYAVLDLDNDI